MNGSNGSDKNFIGYEYTSVVTNRDMETVYIDSFSSFGWNLEGRSHVLQSPISVNLKFKRDRKINNKTELNKLQRQFEAGISEIQSLERSKSLGAASAAYIIGIIGTALMAGSVFSYLAGMITLCIVLAVPAFIGWTVSYIAYNSIKKKKTAKVSPLIDKQYDEIYEVCERASKMVAN